MVLRSPLVLWCSLSTRDKTIPIWIWSTAEARRLSRAAERVGGRLLPLHSLAVQETLQALRTVASSSIYIYNIYTASSLERSLTLSRLYFILTGRYGLSTLPRRDGHLRSQLQALSLWLPGAFLSLLLLPRPSFSPTAPNPR